MAEIVVETFGLTRVYGRKAAVRDLNLTVRRGEVYGFLGRNGAGKTTTIRMLLGLIKPTSGRAEVLGVTPGPSRPDVFARIGCVVETPAFYGNLTVRENMDIQRRLLGVRRTSCIEEALATVGLAGERDRRAGTLSTGMRQRLGIARALMHDPELLILDEPTNGLDPVGIREVRSLIRRLAAERQITVFMSSHILAEVQQVATRIGILHQGSLVEEVDYAELQRRSRTYLELEVSDPPWAAWVVEERLGLHDYCVVDGGRIRLFEALDRAAAVNRALVLEGIEVRQLTTSRENLEDHFVKLTEGDSDAERDED